MQMNKLGSIFVPQHLIEQQDPPKDFVRRLRLIFGNDMHVEWNPKKQRWVIELCVQHNATLPDGEHCHLCQRSYVWLVQGDSGEYMPLGDRVIEKLHEKETYRQYGTGEAGLARWRQAGKDFDDEQAKKQREMIADKVRYARKHNKSTWNRFKDMFQRHDMRPNK